MSEVRVRFAPSPTGALHIGGVRTALFNYLFARKNDGAFVLRIEDTDQTRFVEGAEQYISDSLNWCGLVPDESPEKGGEFGPYRQSERKEVYGQYCQKLVEGGHAYYAFDTPEELDQMRERLKETKAINQTYNSVTRTTMKNSLTLSPDEVDERIKSGEPYVVRLKIDPKEEVRFHDLIRGWVKVHSSTLDDKVIMKSDGLPTYHLANVVDDHLMKISHVIRGEEWLPSLPTHVLLYRYLGWGDQMPEFAHLPLILKPDGNGKLSKRAADKLGFPIFPLNWTDPESSELSKGFRETGYDPEALINFLAFLGWNPGDESELYTLEALINAFSLEKVNKSGTKFDLDKLKWYNQQYLKDRESSGLAKKFMQVMEAHGRETDQNTAERICSLFKERVTFEYEIPELARFFFEEPETLDEKVVRKRLNEDSKRGLNLFADALLESGGTSAEELKELFSSTLNGAGINPGSVMQLLRVTVSGVAGGPDLMEILSILGSERVSKRIRSSLNRMENEQG